jgi:hypothetical protein
LRAGQQGAVQVSRQYQVIGSGGGQRRLLVCQKQIESPSSEFIVQHGHPVNTLKLRLKTVYPQNITFAQMYFTAFLYQNKNMELN